MFTVGSIFIPVTNIEKATEWYEKNLGVKKIDSWEDGKENGAGFYFPYGSTQLGLVEVESPQPTEFEIKGNRRNVYFNFVVNDIEAVYRVLNTNGVVTTDIEDFNGMKGFDFFDPDENTFSVVDEAIDSPFHKDNVRKMQQQNKS